MRITAAVITVATMLVAGTALLSAKGPTVKLTISGGDLRSSIEVTTLDALVHVWGDQFIGVPAAKPRLELPRYEVAFHVLPNGAREQKVMYVVKYVLDPASDDAFIYLPGPGDEHYGLNSSTILRAGSGRWHQAVSKWAQAVNSNLPR